MSMAVIHPGPAISTALACRVYLAVLGSHCPSQVVVCVFSATPAFLILCGMSPFSVQQTLDTGAAPA